MTVPKDESRFTLLDELITASANIDESLENRIRDSVEGRGRVQAARHQLQGVSRKIRTYLEERSLEEIDDYFKGYESKGPLAPVQFGQEYGAGVAAELHGDVLSVREQGSESALDLLNQAGAALRKAGAHYHAAAAFRRARICASDVGLVHVAASSYQSEMVSTEEWLRRRKSPTTIIYAIWRCTSSYGQSWLRWLGCVSLAVVCFGLIYLPAPDKAPWRGTVRLEAPYEPTNDWFDAFFASLIALGFPGLAGVSPANDFTKLILVLNGLTGFVLLAVLITLLTQRISSRI
jgi:hypothetical protein